MSEDDAKKEAGRQGGLARKDALSPEERKAIAQRGALARWGARATHKGNFKEQFGFDVDCYVLDDAQKTAVISQRGIAAALGFSPQGGGRLPRFISGKSIAPYLGLELKEKLANPLRFQGPRAVSGFQQERIIHGFDVTLLIDVCKAIVAAEADGKLTPNQTGIAKQAHVILTASARAGIKGLVYALAGYDPTREEVIEAFKLYVRQEAREYEKEFPDQLYAEWYRLYELPRPEKNKPWKFKHLTVKHVWTPIANSNGKVYLLTQALRSASNERRKKLHQFLSEIGVKALRTQLGQILGIAQVSETKDEYEARINRVFGQQRDLFQ